MRGTEKLLTLQKFTAPGQNHPCDNEHTCMEELQESVQKSAVGPTRRRLSKAYGDPVKVSVSPIVICQCQALWIPG